MASLWNERIVSIVICDFATVFYMPSPTPIRSRLKASGMRCSESMCCQRPPVRRHEALFRQLDPPWLDGIGVPRGAGPRKRWQEVLFVARFGQRKD